MNQVNDALPPRVREIVAQAEKRHQEWRDLDLSKFDAELVTPDGEPQMLRVWVNAPSALREALSKIETYNGAQFYAILATYTGMDTQELSDLFDCWPDALRHFVVLSLFRMVSEYRDERLELFFSSAKVSPQTNS